MNTFTDFLAGWHNYITDNPNQRMGQSLFNYMYQEPSTRELAEEIVTGSLDPFYKPENIMPALRLVEEVFNKA